MTGVRSAASGVRPVVYFVCTGNAARSPMAAAMLKALDGEGRFDVRSAGAFVIEGLPMSVRTRRALARHGLADHAHRSHQFGAADAAAADVIAVMEPAHVNWMRARFPEAAGVTGSLRRLARYLPASTSPVSLAGRVAVLGLAGAPFAPWEEVVDPGGGDQAVFHRCAAELFPLVDELHRRLRAALPQ